MITHTEKIVYQLHAKGKPFQRRVKKTRRHIQDILRLHQRPYCSYSTGKDSLVLLALCQDMSPGMWTLFHDSGVELPDSYDMLKQAERCFHISIHRIQSPVDVLAIYQQKRALLDAGNKDYAYTRAMKQPILRWQQKHQRDVVFIGLRKQESRNRRILLSTIR